MKARAKLDPKAEVELVTYPRAKGFLELVSERLGGNTEAAVSRLSAIAVIAMPRPSPTPVRSPWRSPKGSRPEAYGEAT